ncbi:HAT [Theobroma cacao]|nr:HAT [Theobroma cacao]
MDELFRCYRNMLQPSPRDVGENGQQCLTSMGQGTSGGCNDNVVSTLIGKDTERTKKRLDRFKKHRLNTGSKELKTELEKYLSEPVDDEGFNDDEFDVLVWWKLNQFRFPILAAIARDVLAVPLSTVASESAFSIGGRVFDAYRSSLTPKVVQALICAQDWLLGKARGDPDLIEDDLDKLDKLDFELATIALETIAESEPESD